MYGFRYQFALQVLLILVGIGWCGNSLRNIPNDWQEFRTTKVSDVRTALLTSWAITALVACGLVYFTPGVVQTFLRLLN